MEPAWIKICGSIFRLTSRTIVQPNGGTREVPCYSLTKTEFLYIATKFNDEARAKLVLRWEELEKADGDAGGEDIQYDHALFQRRAARHGHPVMTYQSPWHLEKDLQAWYEKRR
ncbi:Rha family transcriptional regulator [Prevotella communis]|uniref:Rha family transcriptional regulator n=1 Tax=Prevotella communis TaxID=2913614 RepID=UPI001EDC6BE7|nr:Rha family transcriptional regulator [Prevotella communis]UKK59483.1 Rha family transcriptional regulator [Prevotella communis]